MKKELLISFVIIFFTFYGCSVLKNSEQKQVLFEYERTACYGTCPVYHLTVFTSGKAILEGKDHLDKIGTFEAKLERKRLEQLMEEFESISFFDLKDTYRSQFKDLPTKYITYHNSGKSKQIMAYDNIPKNLQLLMDKIEELTKELEWEKIE